MTQHALSVLSTANHLSRFPPLALSLRVSRPMRIERRPRAYCVCCHNSVEMLLPSLVSSVSCLRWECSRVRERETETESRRGRDGGRGGAEKAQEELKCVSPSYILGSHLTPSLPHPSATATFAANRAVPLFLSISRKPSRVCVCSHIGFSSTKRWLLEGGEKKSERRRARATTAAE